MRYWYWALRRRWGFLAHIASVLGGLARNYVRLRLWQRGKRRNLVAISLLEHMGDIVAAEPVSRCARRAFPSSRIVWVTHASNRELVSTYAGIDDVLTVTCLTEWMLLWRLGLLDSVWDLHLSGRVCPKCLLPLQKSGPGPDMATYYRFGSLLDAQCLSAGIPTLDDGPVLVPPRTAIARADRLRLPRDFVVVHCTSSDPRRDWPAENWRAVVDQITSRSGLSVIEVGLTARIIRWDTPQERSVCGKLSVLETAEVIRRAVLFIGIDSGPAHLANAVGTPGVVLLGHYLGLDSYMPYSGGYRDGRSADLVRADGPVAALGVPTVLDRVRERLRPYFTEFERTGGRNALERLS